MGPVRRGDRRSDGDVASVRCGSRSPRGAFHRAYANEAQESFADAHVRAFERFEGGPQRVRFVPTQMLAAGVALPVLSARVGHARASTTLHTDAASVPAWDRAAAETLSAVLRAGRTSPPGSTASGVRGQNRCRCRVMPWPWMRDRSGTSGAGRIAGRAGTCDRQRLGSPGEALTGQQLTIAVMWLASLLGGCSSSTTQGTSSLPSGGHVGLPTDGRSTAVSDWHPDVPNRDIPVRGGRNVTRTKRKR